VLTAESVRLDLPVAGPASRMAAYAVDFVAIFLLALLVSVALAGSSAWISAWVAELLTEFAELFPETDDPVDMSRFRTFLLVFLAAALTLQVGVELVYFAFFEHVWRGQSPGKRLLKLRVVSDDGAGITTGQSVARNLLRIVDVLPTQYIVGLASMLASSNGKRLGDWASGTLVIRLDRPPGASEIDDEPQPGDETFLFDARQLRAIGRVEATLLRRALRQSSEGEPEARRRILEAAATALGARIGLASPLPPAQHAAFLRALHRAVTLHGS
jgi:uncharacterized RDD family membrane protein YckC